jgi:NAD-dependent SIR2 family protein deacetylase
MPLYNVGDTPGEGTYECTHCGWHIQLAIEIEPLPKCAVCEREASTRYVLVEDEHDTDSAEFEYS